MERMRGEKWWGLNGGREEKERLWEVERKKGQMEGMRGNEVCVGGLKREEEDGVIVWISGWAAKLL